MWMSPSSSHRPIHRMWSKLPAFLVRHRLAYLLLLLTSVLVLFTLDSTPATAWFSASRTANRKLANSKLQGAGAVAVLDLNNFHDEVHGAVIWSLQQFAGLDVRLYRPAWRWYFEHSISSFWSSRPRDPQLLIADLREDHSIRHLIMTTSDWDFGKLGGELEAAWDERPHDAKFDITAVRHWAGDMNRFTGMAERGALALLGLGDHVANNLRQSVDEMLGAHREAGNDRAADAWGKVKIRTFIPVFPAGRFPHVGDSIFDPRPDGSNSMDMVVIQSTHFNEEHRNMNDIFTVLNSSLHGESLEHCFEAEWVRGPRALGLCAAQRNYASIHPSARHQRRFQAVHRRSHPKLASRGAEGSRHVAHQLCLSPFLRGDARGRSHSPCPWW